MRYETVLINLDATALLVSNAETLFKYERMQAEEKTYRMLNKRMLVFQPKLQLFDYSLFDE